MIKQCIAIMSHRITAGVGLLIVGSLSVLWFWPLRGLLGEYYANMTWTEPSVIARRDTTFDLGNLHQQYANFPHTEFSIRWSGWIRIDHEGEYTFSLLSDDGSSLVLRNTLLINNGGFHAFQKRSATVFLSEGLHSIQINYFQGSEDYAFKVFWTPPGGREAFIPPNVLYQDPFPVRGIGFISRKLVYLYPVAWALLIASLLVCLIRTHAEKSRQSLKAFVQNIALACVALCISLLMLEGVLRGVFVLRENRQDTQTLLRQSQETEFSDASQTYSLKGMVQPASHENIVFELKPRLQGKFLGVPLMTNSQGLRDREYEYQKPENTFRIVGLGDSSMFGWGVRLEDSLLKVLERKLNEGSSSTRYDVMNFAVPGYNTAIEVDVFLEKCRKYAPDLVIMHFNTNDYDIPFFMKPPQSYSTLRKSYLADFVYSRYQSLFGEQNREMIPFVFGETVDIEESALLDQNPDIPDEYRHMVGERGFIAALERLLNATRKQGIPVVVYVVKAYPGLDPAYTPNIFRTQQLALITRLGQKMGFSLLNMYPAYMAYRREHPEANDKVFWVSESDSHPSAVAHQVEAEALYNALVDNGLLTISSNPFQ